MNHKNPWHKSFLGVLLGTAVGDSLGLPAEGMSPECIQRRWRGPWKQRLVLGCGMISDDTELTLFVAQALLEHPEDANAFQRCLAWKLRLWLLGVPSGIGFATLRAILKLWMGFSPTHSGVVSAGNGPAMRSAIIGAYFAEDPAKRRAFVSASTRITHTDRRAEMAALAIAEIAAWTIHQNGTFQACLINLPSPHVDDEWMDLCRKLLDALEDNLPVKGFADRLGLQKGVTGYAYHSVPVALYAFARHPDEFHGALEAAIQCGGDTDTVGAMVGALCGARLGLNSIPSNWISRLRDWPRSKSLAEKIAERLAEQKLSNSPSKPVAYLWPALMVRNILFLIIILFHGLRRLFPPY